MKTFQEIEDWCAGAKKQFGDPARPVGQAFFRYQKPGADASLSVDAEDARRRDLLLCSEGEPGILLLFLFRDEPPLSLDIRNFFTPTLVGGGIWYLTPSLNMPGHIHIFVNLYYVTTPAPWEAFGERGTSKLEGASHLIDGGPRHGMW